MAGEGTKRIIDLTEAAETQSGDYIAIDSTGRGTRKLPAGFMATAEDLSEEQTERRTADATLDGKITAEAQARLDADNALGDQITALDEKTEADAALIQNPTKTVSGSLVSFTDGAEMPMVACTASIEPQQSGTGTPSPDNVRQISGWESVNLYKSGKNIVENIGTATTVSGLTIAKNSDGSFTVNGTSTAVVAWTVNYNLEKILKNGQQYILSGCTGGNYANTYSLRVADANGSAKAISVNGDASFTADGTAKSLQLLVRSGQTLNNVTFYPMIRLASDTDPTYEPYTGTTTTVNLGRTVYGGTLDVVSGVLTVDREMVDLNSLSYERITNGSVYIFQTYIAGKKYPSTTTDFITSCYEVQDSSGFGLSNKSCTTGAYSSAFYFRDDDYTDAASFKASLSGQTLVYPLMTPQTYTLTPTEIQTLLGENNVWADSGDVEITYRRDISIVINNLESALNG